MAGRRADDGKFSLTASNPCGKRVNRRGHGVPEQKKVVERGA
jgi:hypothetical protein